MPKSKQHKFYYLHGFNSAADPDSDKVRLLKSIGEVVLLSYDSFATYDQIMKSLVEANEPDLDWTIPVIVGTSLGGFYAAELGKCWGLPCVMINPAWRPLDVLGPQSGQTFTNYKTGEVRTLEKHVTDSYLGKSFDTNRYYFPLVLLDEGDELLDSQETSQQLSSMKCEVIMFEGGDHRFAHMEQALKPISDYASVCEYVTDLNT
jgi:uncharacterized protein